jgi:hypothetical protein
MSMDKVTPFKFSDVKQFPFMFWLLFLMNVTTYGVFWSFHPMFMQVLEAAMGIPHDAASEITTYIPVVQVTIVFTTMGLSILTKNETWFIWTGSVLCVVTVTIIPMFQLTGVFWGWVIMIMHSTYGAMFLITRSALVTKILPLKMIALGNGFVNANLCIANFIYPVITGSIMGNIGSRQDIYYCMYLFIGVGSMGIFVSTWLLIYSFSWTKPEDSVSLSSEGEKIDEEEINVGADGDTDVEVEMMPIHQDDKDEFLMNPRGEVGVSVNIK